VKRSFTGLSFYATLIKFPRNWSRTVTTDISLLHWRTIVQHVVCCEQRSGAINRISVFAAISLSTMFDIVWDLLYILRWKEFYQFIALLISSLMYFYHLRFFTHAWSQHAIKLLFAPRCKHQYDKNLNWLGLNKLYTDVFLDELVIDSLIRGTLFYN